MYSLLAVLLEETLKNLFSSALKIPKRNRFRSYETSSIMLTILIKLIFLIFFLIDWSCYFFGDLASERPIYLFQIFH